MLNIYVIKMHIAEIIFVKTKSSNHVVFFFFQFNFVIGTLADNVMPEHVWLFCALHNSIQIEFDCLLMARAWKSISIGACWICWLYSGHVQQTSVMALRKELPAQYIHHSGHSLIFFFSCAQTVCSTQMQLFSNNMNGA